MKKLLLVGVLAVFMLGIVACGGASPDSLAKDSMKVMNEYTAALKKVATKEDLIGAMKTFQTAMSSIKEKGMELMKKNPDAMKNLENKELQTKMQEVMKNMMAANMAPNVMKFMTDPEVQKLSKEMMK